MVAIHNLLIILRHQETIRFQPRGADQSEPTIWRYVALYVFVAGVYCVRHLECDRSILICSSDGR